jgi:hypothetical protein
VCRGGGGDSKRTREKMTRSEGTLIQWLEPPTPGSWHFFMPRLIPRLLQKPSSTHYYVLVPGASITDTSPRYSTGNGYYTAYAREGSGNPHSVPTTIQWTDFNDFLVMRMPDQLNIAALMKHLRQSESSETSSFRASVRMSLYTPKSNVII